MAPASSLPQVSRGLLVGGLPHGVGVLAPLLVNVSRILLSKLQVGGRG